MKKVLYLGREDKFFQKLKNSLKEEIDINIEHINPHPTVVNILKNIKDSSPDLVILENDQFQHLNQRILSGVRNTSKFKTKIFISLCEEDKINQPSKHFALNDMIYFIKGIETSDVENCIKSLLYPEQAQVKNTAKVSIHDKIILNQVIRVVHIARDHAHVETNIDVTNGSTLSMNFPYQKELFKSNKHKLTEKSCIGITSHFKFNYHLEYQYLTIPFRHEDKNKIIIDIDYDLKEKPITTKLYSILEEQTKKPKKIILAQDKIEKPYETFNKEKDLLTDTAILSLKTLFLNWLIEKSVGLPLQTDNITIYDPNQTLSKIDSLLFKDAFTTIIERDYIVKPHEEILRDRSSLIVICYSSENSLEKISQLINSTTQHKDYFPFFLIFNYSELSNEILRDKMAYHFIVATKIGIEETTIQKMIQVFRKKRTEKENNRTKVLMNNLRKKDMDFNNVEETTLHDYRIFKDIDDRESLFFYPFEVEIVWISEFELVFKSNHKLNSGDIVSTSNSFKMQLLVVDHIKDSKESMIKNSYRGIIHFIDEANRSKLRRFLNEVAQLNSTRDSELSAHEASEIKKKYFG